MILAGGLIHITDPTQAIALSALIVIGICILFRQ